MSISTVLKLGNSRKPLPMALKAAVESGIGFVAVAPAAKFLGTSEVELGTRLLGKSAFYRLKKSPTRRLPPRPSATLARLVRLRDLANQTFKDEAKAARFMKTPHPALDGETPFEAAMSEFGAEAVNDLLGRGLVGTAA